jgi:type I restriction enzyme S subunit
MGAVPTHWKVAPVKRFLRSLDQRRIPLSSVERGARQGEFPYYGASGVIDHVDQYLFDKDHVLVSEDGANLLARSSPISFIARGRYWVNNHAHILEGTAGDEPDFWAYRIESENIAPFVTGSAQPKLTIEALMNLAISAPPTVGERRAIVRFIEVETAKIDALIAKQEQLLATLREDRTATITHAVTKGLDPGVQMRDSGNAWTGPIPRHWDALPMKRVATRITDGAHISPDTEGGVYDFVSTKDVSDTGIDFAGALKTTPASYEYLVHNGCKPDVGDVLFSKDGTVGRTVVVSVAHEFVVASSLIIIRCDSQLINPWYAHYVCQSANTQQQVDSFVKGAGLPRLSISNLRKVVVTRPPINEQLKIVDFLDERCGKIAALIAKAIGVIDTLREYRSALITDAVTGKIDVRGAA